MATSQSLFDVNIFDPVIFDTKTQYFEEFNESVVSINDAVNRQTNAKRTLTEGGGDLFDANIFDSNIFDTSGSLVDVSDSLSRLRTSPRLLVESVVTVVDSVVRMFGSKRSLTDTTTNSDSLTRKLTALRTLTERLGGVMFDTANNLFDPNIFDDADKAGLTDGLTRSYAGKRPITEISISIVDNLVRKLSANRIISESTTVINDVVVAVRALFRTLPETVIISDALQKSKGAFRTLTETAITIIDSLTTFKPEVFILRFISRIKVELLFTSREKQELDLS